VLQDLSVPKPYNSIPAAFQESRSLGIALYPHSVLTSVDLKHDLGLETAEIYNERTDPFLGTELGPIELPRSKVHPHSLLCIRLCMPELARARNPGSRVDESFGQHGAGLRKGAFDPLT
jgi:hypothetical protein